jgi:hypothetical protein
MSAWSISDALVDGGRPTAVHIASTERPTPMIIRPPDNACAVMASDASTAGCRD